jgi:lysophospholipase L1-like esterase
VNARGGRAHAGSLAINIFLLVTGVALSLVVAEGLLRLFPNRLPGEIRAIVTASPDNLGIYHPFIGVLHRPNADLVISGRDFSTVHHTDGFGFRNKWPWPPRAEIVAVGDSLVFGYGVRGNQAWPGVIDRALPETHVVNLGLVGAGPEQYLRLYETFGQNLRPKLLLVGFFARNDFWDAELFDDWLKSDRQCNYMVWRDYGRSNACANDLRWHATVWAHRSYLFNLLFGFAKYVRSQFTSGTHNEIVRIGDGFRIELDVADFKDKTLGSQPDRRGFQLVLRALQKMNTVAKAHGTKVLIVFQPSKEEVYLDAVGKTIPDPSRPLQEELKKSGIDYLNLTPVFRERAVTGEKLFFEVDGHPSAAGQELIADAVLAYLKQNATEYGLNTAG